MRIELTENRIDFYDDGGKLYTSFYNNGEGYEGKKTMTTEEVRKELNEATKMQRETTRVVNEALCHAAGKLAISDKVEEEAYNRGLNDCWEMVGKLSTMSVDQRSNVLCMSYRDAYLTDVLKNLTPQEALAKLRAWEEKKAEEERKKQEEAEKIQIGDVVEITDKCLNRRRGIFLKDNGSTFALLTKSECTSNLTEVGFSTSNWTIQKTGEHVDILGALKE